MKELHCDVLVVGGGVGGCAAALAAAEAGKHVVLTEESDWLGGQFTSQAVPPDEHGWIEHYGCTTSYRRFRNLVRDYYRLYYPVTPEAAADAYLNPGNGWVSPLCCEPRVALAVLEGMLAPLVSSGVLVILLNHRPMSADLVSPDCVGAVTLRNQLSGGEVTISAPFVLDATELGDLLPLCKAEFVTGAESQSQTGEPSAPEQARPTNTQAFSVCFAMDYRQGEDHTISPPSEYDFWRGYVPQLNPSWPGPLLSWEASHPRTLEPIQYRFDPNAETGEAFCGLWTYRRVLDPANFAAHAFRGGGITIVNWPMLDYMEGDLCASTEAEQGHHLRRARQLSLSLFYWLQTEAPRPDGGAGWSGLRLRGDLLGSDDGLAKRPYIRESRRIRALTTVVEQDLSEAHRPGCNRGRGYDDSVGIGCYRIDLHPSCGGDNYIDVAALPFQIPLSALIPQRITNLLAAAKNLGTTHITNGCYRLHPVEWNIGEAAGLLAAFCLQRGAIPHQVVERKVLLGDFQRSLLDRAIALAWPKAFDLSNGDPHRHAQGRKRTSGPART